MTPKRPLRIIRDTREQDGFTFKSGCYLPPPIVTVGTLNSGDYSLAGFEAKVAVERKSLQDLVGCLGRERERFVRELERLRGLDSACVVVEAPASALMAGAYRGALDPKAGWQSVVAWQMRYGVPFIWCAGKDDAEAACYDFLRHYARDRYAELKALMDESQLIEEATT